MKALPWIAGFLFLLVIGQAIRGVIIGKEAERWERLATVRSDSIAQLLPAVARYEAREADRTEELAAGEAERLILRSESERRGRVIAALRNGVPSVPAVTPDTCLPWANRAAALAVLTDSLTSKGTLDSLRIVKADAAFLSADSGRREGLSLVGAMRRQLVAADSLLRHHPTIPKTRLALALDARTDLRGGTALAALESRGFYAGVEVTEALHSRAVVGYAKHLKLF